MKCPICGEGTWYGNTIEADEDWADRVARARELLEPSPDSEDEQELIPKLKDARVRVHDDQLWIHYWDAYHGGQRDKLKPGTLVMVGNQCFEILEYVQALREYLVQTFSLTLSEEDLRKLAGDYVE